jgi:hypothetical protein
MAEMNADDIIIVLAEHLRARAQKEPDISIEFTAIEQTFSLPEGSVAKHLDDAAKDAGLTVVRRGSTRASLTKTGGGIHIA